ncbi:unnamed protein product [Allacma fusca]|uniref:Peptidase S1 domain-containing protein n=1 Tax=Allacma fusca TaxID=39272 RepID=A0A8J2JP96_9HEXA|nr:unnamed protein product [Allacma fusca]
MLFSKNGNARELGFLNANTGNKCDCRENRNARLARVYDGHPVQEPIPWQVSLQQLREYDGQSRWKHECGGSLISDRFVVTAKHCIGHADDKNDYRVIVGTVNKTEFNERNVYELQGFKFFNYLGTVENEHDIAILKIKDKDGGPVKCDQFIQPICLGAPRTELLTDCYVSGWGATSQTEATDILQLAKIKQYTFDECAEIWNQGSRTRKFQGYMTCAGIIGKNTGSSFGDSGGPLACIDPTDRVPYLSGVVSGGNGFHATEPAIYANVLNYELWVHEMMKLWEDKVDT